MFNSELNNSSMHMNLIDDTNELERADAQVLHPIKSSSFSELDTIKKALKEKNRLGKW